jgi:hypothetical protein
MPAVKKILKHVRVERARRKRTCGRNRANHVIKAGENCLVVQNGQDAPNYCLVCGSEVLRVAQLALDELKKDLN